MKKSFIMLSIALAISCSIEAKRPASTQEKSKIMDALHPHGEKNNNNYVPTTPNTSFTTEVQNIIKEVDVNFQDSNYYNNTPLCSAARFGATKKLSFLLKNGAEPSLTIKNSEGSIPLGDAAENGNYQTVKAILQWSKAHGTKGKNDPATLLKKKDNYTGGRMTPLVRAQYAMKNGWDRAIGRTQQDYKKTINILQSYSK